MSQFGQDSPEIYAHVQVVSRLAHNSPYVLEFLPTLSLELQRIHADPKEDTVDEAISKTKTELSFFLL